MGCFDVNVPHSLSQDIRLTDADKRVWMVMRLDRKDSSISNVCSPTRLAERTGLSRVTIYSSIARLAAAGWYDTSKRNAIINRSIKPGGWTNVPAELLVSKELQPRDVVMWGLLKAEGFQRQSDGKFTYKSLSKYAQVCLKTVRRAVRALVNADWLDTKQKNQMAAIEFTLDSPTDKYCQEQIRLLDMRKQRKGGHCEAIALAIVQLVAEPTKYCVNGRYDHLANPDTGEFMEIDIFMPEFGVAIEFQGAQHFHPTSFASAEDVAKQQKRDTIKIALLEADESIPVVLTAEDLSIAAVTKKLQGLVPLRDLRLYRRLVDYLNNAGEAYRRETQRLAGQEA